MVVMVVVMALMRRIVPACGQQGLFQVGIDDLHAVGDGIKGIGHGFFARCPGLVGPMLTLVDMAMIVFQPVGQ